MIMTKVIDGKLCIEQNDVKIWFTLATIDKHILRLEGELALWHERRFLLMPLFPLPSPSGAVAPETAVK